MNKRTTFCLVVLCVGTFLIFGIFSFVVAMPHGTEEEVHVRVRPGEGVDEITRILAEEGVVRSPGIFKFYTFLSGTAHRLKPGFYTFSKPVSIAAVARRLVDGPKPVNFLIPEGRALRDIETDLVRLGLIARGELVHASLEKFRAHYLFLEGKTTLEGFLFPDTYRIVPGTDAASIITQILDNFSRKAWPLIFSLKEWYRTVIIASILEKEVRLPTDRAIVAGILEKRLSIGMALQVDTTVLYAACGEKYENCPSLTAADYLLKSPYNTYTRPGLPPTPIANPGRDALRAALVPQISPYLYYLSVPETGETVFARDFDAHRRNKIRYLHGSP